MKLIRVVNKRFIAAIPAVRTIVASTSEGILPTISNKGLIAAIPAARPIVASTSDGGLPTLVPAVIAVVASTAVEDVLVQIPGIYSNSVGETIRNIHEVLNASEIIALSFGTQFTDAYSLNEARDILLNKAPADAAAGAEQVVLESGRIIVDVSRADETLSKILEIYLADNAGLSETFDFTNGSIIAAEDASSFGEQLIFDISRVLLDTSVGTELLTITLSRVFADTAATQEVTACTLARPAADTALYSESGVINKQAYIVNDEYTSPGYIGTQITF